MGLSQHLFNVFIVFVLWQMFENYSSHAGCKITAKKRSKTEKAVSCTGVLDSENMKPTTPMVDNGAGSDEESRIVVSGSALFCIQCHFYAHFSNGMLAIFVNNA